MRSFTKKKYKLIPNANSNHTYIIKILLIYSNITYICDMNTTFYDSIIKSSEFFL